MKGIEMVTDGDRYTIRLIGENPRRPLTTVFTWDELVSVSYKLIQFVKDMERLKMRNAKA